MAADFLVAQPSLDGTGPTSVTSELHDFAASVSNNAINKDLEKLRKNKRTNLNPSNGALNSSTISAQSPRLPSDDEAMGDLGDDAEPSVIVLLNSHCRAPGGPQPG